MDIVGSNVGLVAFGDVGGASAEPGYRLHNGTTIIVTVATDSGIATAGCMSLPLFTGHCLMGVRREQLDRSPTEADICSALPPVR